MEAMGSAPSADNSQPWCFEWDGTSLIARVRRRGGFPQDYHATVLALGAATENLAWALQSIGLDISGWSIGLPDRDGVFARGPLNDVLTAPIPTASPVWMRRHTNRLPYQSTIEPDVGARLEKCRVGQVGVRGLDEGDIRQAADWVKQASEVRFQTREVNEWFAASLRYGNTPEERADGLHVNTLALPPGGVGLLKLMSDWERLQWLNRIKAYKLFASIEAANFQKSPLVIAITGPADKASAFDAGRCLQQVWLKLTELGLSAHPFYVVSDLLQRLESGGVPGPCQAQAFAIRKHAHDAYGSENTLHCLLRVGKPIGEIAVSGRLPINKLLCNA